MTSLLYWFHQDWLFLAMVKIRKTVWWWMIFTVSLIETLKLKSEIHFNRASLLGSLFEVETVVKHLM